MPGLAADAKLESRSPLALPACGVAQQSRHSCMHAHAQLQIVKMERSMYKVITTLDRWSILVPSGVPAHVAAVAAAALEQ